MALKKIKVRFNLSRGKNYMKWKVEFPGHKPVYYDPNETQLRLVKCTLKNHKKTAEKIYQGASKTVCAWVLCEVLAVYPAKTTKTKNLEQIKYNPRIRPNWIWRDDVVVDGCYVREMVSDNNKLFLLSGGISSYL